MKALTAWNLLALAACGALAAWTWQEAQQPLPEVPSLTQSAPGAAPLLTAATAPPPTFRMPPKNTYAQLVTRPPFSPSRRPPRAQPASPPVVQKPETPVPQPVTAPQVTLVGIVIAAEKSIAMVHKPGVEEMLRLAKGESFDGWLVEGVLPDRLVLSHKGELLELELTEAAQRSGPMSSPAPGQSGRARPRRP